MDAIFDRPSLTQALDACTKSVNKNAPKLILSHVRLTLEGGVLTLVGSDGVVQMTASLQVSPDAVQAQGASALPAQKFLEILRSLKSDTVSLKIDEAQATIKGGNSTFRLNTLPAQDYPLMEVGKTSFALNLNASDLALAISRTKFAMAVGDVRAFLNGLLFDVTQSGIHLVATDGHRLSVQTLILANEVSDAQAILPRPAVLEIERVSDELAKRDANAAVSLEFSPDTVRTQVVLNEVLSLDLVARLVEGKYPDYQGVIPSDFSRAASFDKTALDGALRRALILSNDQGRKVAFVFDGGGSTVCAKNAQNDALNEALNVHYEGDPLEISFNAQYLKEMIAMMSDTLVLNMSEATHPVKIVSPNLPNSQFVLMPIRL